MLPPELLTKLQQYRQEHLLAWWGELSSNEQSELMTQLQELDLESLQELYQRRNQRNSVSLEKVRPVSRPGKPTVTAQHRDLACAAWRKGKVAYLVVAGGQGSRLGFEHPKGMFPIGPVTDRCLFQIHVEKVRALKRRHGASLPFLVMTSPSTHDETVRFFADNRYFGLDRSEVHFFCQGTMPAVDFETGKILLESKSRLFLSPNGHGGTLTALADSGLLDRLKRSGVETIYYFQVDNPLVNLADPGFLGEHLQADSQVSSKVVAKETPEDRLGVFVLLDGRLSMIEYSDLPGELARKQESSGGLLFWAGNPAIHLFQVNFLEQVTRGGTQVPWHLARKKVPFLGPEGNMVQPQRENALKFEMFIFDVLPLADRWLLRPTNRAGEFMPLKNATGADSPASVRQGMSNQAGSWLENAGVRVPRQANGDVSVAIEISPLFALDQEELASKMDRNQVIEGPTCFTE